MLRNNLEERILHLHHGGNVKPDFLTSWNESLGNISKHACNRQEFIVLLGVSIIHLIERTVLGERRV
jgi:hypothetical protein